MFLPIRGFHDLGQRRSLGPPDQFQDLCSLALAARRAGFLGLASLAFLPALASFFGAALALPVAAFWPLGATFFWVAPFFEEAVCGATCVPCSPTVAAFSVNSGFYGRHGESFLRLVGARRF